MLAEISYLDFLSSGYGKGYLQKIIHVTCLSYLRTGCVGVLSLSLPLAIQDAWKTSLGSTYSISVTRFCFFGISLRATSTIALSPKCPWGFHIHLGIPLQLASGHKATLYVSLQRYIIPNCALHQMNQTQSPWYIHLWHYTLVKSLNPRWGNNTSLQVQMLSYFKCCWYIISLIWVRPLLRLTEWS